MSIPGLPSSLQCKSGQFLECFSECCCYSFLIHRTKSDNFYKTNKENFYDLKLDRALGSPICVRNKNDGDRDLEYWL